MGRVSSEVGLITLWQGRAALLGTRYGMYSSSHHPPGTLS